MHGVFNPVILAPAPSKVPNEYPRPVHGRGNGQLHRLKIAQTVNITVWQTLVEARIPWEGRCVEWVRLIHVEIGADEAVPKQRLRLCQGLGFRV
jgi:hypothetical protein